MSKDNFKDDFERNRQEIKPDHTNEFNDQSENEETSFDIRDEQQHFPPRNASRRHRKRDLNSDDYQAQEHVQENSHNSHSEKRPGLLGGFVNKQQDTSHREDSAEPARTNDQGEKIRDYAKEHPHEIQNQPKENHSNNRELKSEQQRDQRRDIHNPEKGKDVHRSNINNVSREDRAKQEPHGQFKKSSEKDVNHTRSNNNSYSQEQQHKKVGPIAGGNQINHRENETHPHTNEPNASQRLDHESKKIDQNHRQQPGNTRPDQRHTKFNKKAAAGAAGVAGAVAKHEHDKKQREPLSDKNEKQNHARQQNDKIPNNNKTTSGAVGAAGTRGESQHQRPQQPNDRKRPTHEDERHSRNKKAAMGAGAIGAAGAGAAGAHAAKQHNEKNQQPRKTNRNAATGAGAGAAGASASTQTAHTPPNNKRKKGGCLKRLLPLLAALLLLGALAIFGGMYLFNQNNDENHNNKDNQTEVAKNDNASKDKAENDKANKDKEKSTEETTEETNSNETPGASSESSSEQSNQDTTQSDLNQQQNQTQQDPNSQAQTNSNQQTPSNTNQQNQNSASNNNAQSHTVTGNENLYRIAIRYYGSGSPENVEKIRRANGISGNNISNGQQLIIP
ncbi:LysM peptidoglycan-binding domain-containing protein [Staphylococcus chromogenes]|uniref:LysM peptidoglycan-binding domain-containing protein n=1 Tax=Staphylococcus chromogenes TaxID=46126 RepID=UPI00227A579B|nr:LysM peptidoglycan-binding domain-containing protein [Staphylococcus chromogenes]WAG29665.1 LysM peptidoglycan-binding domain-containing protein [Staphylococcus chromogenes]